MTAADFDAVLDRRLTTTAAVLASKAKEYATADRMHNFKVAATLQNVTPMKALVGMWVKHLVSILDVVEAHAMTGTVPAKAVVDEKVGDAINYLCLLEGLFEEARRQHPPVATDRPAKLLPVADVMRRLGNDDEVNGP